MDDGSPDQCPAICNAYARQDARIKVVHKKNGGLTSAWKEGVRHAEGEWLGFVDSDDWIEPDMYERLYEPLKAQVWSLITKIPIIRHEKKATG